MLNLLVFPVEWNELFAWLTLYNLKCIYDFLCSLLISYKPRTNIIVCLSIIIRILSTHWGRVTHICVSKLTIIGSDNGLLPGWRQAIIWTNAGVLLIGPLWTNFSEILIKILTFSFKKMRLKVSSVKWRPFCLGLNVLNVWHVHGIPWRDVIYVMMLFICGSVLSISNFKTVTILRSQY